MFDQSSGCSMLAGILESNRTLRESNAVCWKFSHENLHLVQRFPSQPTFDDWRVDPAEIPWVGLAVSDGFWYMKFRTQDHFWAKCDRKVMLLLYGTHLIPKTNAMDHWNGAPGFQAQLEMEMELQSTLIQATIYTIKTYIKTVIIHGSYRARYPLHISKRGYSVLHHQRSVAFGCTWVVPS